MSAKAAKPINGEMLRKYGSIFIGWALLVGGSLAWNLRQIDQITLNTAAAAARSSLAKDIGFRNWANSHGGVYIPPTAQTPPNPYLNVPDRDVMTTSGKALTLMNPAYIVREIQQNFSGDLKIKSHLTSLKPLNPLNLPDEWETKALQSFEQGNKEALEVSDLEGKPHLRLMLPLPVTEGCMKCHASQGYKVGDVRGGIGAYVLLEPYLEIVAARSSELTMSHGVIWLIGLFGIGFVFRREQLNIAHREEVSTELQKLFQAIEQSPISTVITDLSANIQYVNEAFLNITGYSREEVIKQNPRILQSGKTPQKTYEEMWNKLTHGESWQGELVNKNKNGSEYTEWVKISPVRNADGLVTNYISVKEDITARKKTDAEIKNLAFYDTLTQLPNRRMLMDRLKQVLASSARSKRQGALLFLDLDNFKNLNDAHGHDLGDQLLQQVAKRLESCVREGDTVARLGGDEFVVMLEDLSEDALEAAAQAETVGEKILATLDQYYILGALYYHSTPSIGVTLFNGHEQSQDDLLKQADIAMYQAKKAGRNTLRFFDPKMQDAIASRVALESDLRSAIAEQEQFQLYYQRQVDSSGRTIGAEALLRWQHPVRGMVPPSEFIPLAEESGLILPLGHWVMATACRQLAAWAAQPGMSHLTLAVNVSVDQFNLPTFVEEVLTLIDYFKVDSSKLKLEITESMLMGNVNDITVKMDALKIRGIQFSMDDFGTGYSSLQYLKLLPLDQLKIDRSFVRDIATDDTDRAIVRTIIAMSESLNLNVIAEGVETEEQRQLLLKKGCAMYQGYLFGKPVPIEQFLSHAG